MTNKHIILCLLILVLNAQKNPITSLSISAKVEASGQNLISIENTNELLDIRTNANSESISDAGRRWFELIPEEASYIIEVNGEAWKGYRYFKNQFHYKLAAYNFTVYHELIKELLNLHSLDFKLTFEDDYSILLQYNTQQKVWRIIKLDIQYTYHVIEQIQVNSQEFRVQENHNKTNTQHSFALRRLDGKGLHQRVNLTLELDLQTSLHVDPKTCNIIIEEILPESTYIDADQLRTVQKYELINVQKPEHAAKQYYYSYTIPFSKFTTFGSRKYNYLYPIHFRYPQPSHLNYTLVPLHPSDKIVLSCNNGTKTLLIEQDPFNNRGQAKIFNGSSEDTKTVSMITFILTIIASMIIMKQLRKI